MKDKNSLVVYTQWLDMLDAMPDNEGAILLLELVRYVKTGATPTFENPYLPILFNVMKNQVDKDIASYEQECESRRAAGRIGGLKKASNVAKGSNAKQCLANVASATSAKQDLANGSTTKQDLANLADNDNEYDNDIKEKDTTDVVSQKNTPPTQQDLERIKLMWNTTCTNFPKVQNLNTSRQDTLKCRIRDMGGMDKAIPILTTIFDKMQKSDFLQGKGSSSWRANFDWVFNNDNNWVKVYEGNYDNVAKSKKVSLDKNVNSIWT